MPYAIVWLVLMAAAFYFFLWRPQQRRMMAVRALQAQLREGDEVMTTSGIYGRVVSLGEDDARLEIAPGTVIHVARGAIGQRLSGSGGGEHDDEESGAG